MHCFSNEGRSCGAQADLKLSVTEDALELVILLPLSLGAGMQVCATTLFVFETVLAGVDLAE